MTSHTLDIVKEARSKALGPFSPSLNISEHLNSRLNKVRTEVNNLRSKRRLYLFFFFWQDLPDDVHTRVSGKLFISLTRVPDGKNVIMSEFSSKEHVIQVNILNVLVNCNLKLFYVQIS